MSASTLTIREIIATQPSAAAILQRFDIDLCAHAAESLEEACADLQLSVDQVMDKLMDAEIESRGAGLGNPAALSTARLIQHIVRTHHHHVRQELPRLAALAQKLAQKHGARAPHLQHIAQIVEELRVDMLAHLAKEEQVLFPFVTQLDQDAMLAFVPPLHAFTTVAQPVFLMVQEHEASENKMDDLERLTSGFEPPADACGTQVALYAGLRAFHADLHQHLQLENDVLFPRAVEREAALNPRR